MQSPKDAIVQTKNFVHEDFKVQIGTSVMLTLNLLDVNLDSTGNLINGGNTLKWTNGRSKEVRPLNWKYPFKRLRLCRFYFKCYLTYTCRCCKCCSYSNTTYKSSCKQKSLVTKKSVHQAEEYNKNLTVWINTVVKRSEKQSQATTLLMLQVWRMK